VAWESDWDGVRSPPLPTDRIRERGLKEPVVCRRFLQPSMLQRNRALQFSERALSGGDASTSSMRPVADAIVLCPWDFRFFTRW